MAVQLLRPAVLDAAPLIHQCAWCGSMRTDLGWQGAGAIVHRIGRYRVSHGICPDCSDRMLVEWRREIED